MDMTQVGGSMDPLDYVDGYLKNNDPTRYSMHAL